MDFTTNEAPRFQYEHERQQALSDAGVPRRFLGMSFDTSPLPESTLAPLRCPRTPQNWNREEWECWQDDPEVFNPYLEALDALGRSWYIFGRTGTGKTGLAVGFLRQAIIWLNNDYGREPSILWRSAPDLLAQIRASYRSGWDGPSEYEIIRECAAVDIFALDDLGVEHAKNPEWLEDILYRLISERHAQERPTVFTSNLTLRQLAGRIGERIAWRIIEMCGEDNLVFIDGQNQRDTKAMHLAVA